MEFTKEHTQVFCPSHDYGEENRVSSHRMHARHAGCSTASDTNGEVCQESCECCQKLDSPLFNRIQVHLSYMLGCNKNAVVGYLGRMLLGGTRIY